MQLPLAVHWRKGREREEATQAKEVGAREREEARAGKTGAGAEEGVSAAVAAPLERSLRLR